MSFDELVGVLVALLAIALAAVIRVLWRLAERVSRLEGETRKERQNRDGPS